MQPPPATSSTSRRPQSADGDRDAHAWADEAQDQRLVTRVCDGDRLALAMLYDRHAGVMLGLALRILRDRGDAEDLVHDVFIEAWKKASTFSRQRGRVRSWLLLRTRSRAIDRLRSLDVARRHAQAHGPTDFPGLQSAAVGDPAAAPDQRRARDALASLPEKQRSVVELAFFEGLSCSEIATRCDTPLGTVKSRLVAGMRELRRVFEVAESPDGV